MAGKPRILIADDTAVNRMLLSDILSNDYDILEAKDGLEAVELMERGEEIALLLLDVVMPNMDGFEVLAWMNQHHWNERVPVVIISSETSPTYISKGFEYGVSDYIIRPFIPELVEHRVRNTISLHAKGPRPEGSGLAAEAASSRSGLSKEALFQLQREKLKFQFLSSASNEVIFDYDLERDLMTFSDRCQEELGLPVVMNGFSKVLYLRRDGHGELFTQLQQKIRATTPLKPDVQDQVLLKTADGSSQWYQLYLRTLWLDKGKGPALCGIVGKLENIHQRILERSKLQERASHDSLTGLCNAQAAQERISAAIAEKDGDSLSAMLLIDVDHFKAANDSYGHQFGDRLLRRVAQAIQKNTRRSDIGARVGGDEFLIYLGGLRSREDISLQCARIFQSLNEPWDAFHYTVCMGIAICPDHGATYPELFRHADQALYASKHAGRNRYMIYCEGCEGFSVPFPPASAGQEEAAEAEAVEAEEAMPSPLEAPAGGSGISLKSEYSLLMSALNASVSKHKLDAHFTLVWANDRYYELFGYTREEYERLFHNQCDLFYKDDPEAWATLSAMVSNALAAGNLRYECVCRMRHRDGRKLWVRLVGTRIDEYVEGCPVSYSVMLDITDQMQAFVEQAATYNNYPGLISKFRVKEDGFYFVDANQKYFDVFQRTDRYLFREMTPASGLSAIAQNYEAFRKGKFVAFSIFQDDIHGKRVYMNVCAECVDWVGSDPVYLLLHTDVTQLTKQNEELERLAFTDLVTGGMNRTRFDMVAGATLHASPVGAYALAWLNMQKFKLINDLAGNAQGNAALKYVHDVIKRHLRPGELVARTAADNYSLLLENESDEALSARLNSMVEDINSFNNTMAHPYFLSFTAGVCRADDPKLEITQIQDRAHLARKEIRKMENGSLCACQFFSEKERAKLLEEKEVENRMRSALQNHEYVVYYQPKLSLSTHTVEGAEALVRWNDPKYGLIPPDRFIPIFEKNGFVVQLDLYVLDAVCARIRKWLDKGLRVRPVSVNVSRVHFTAPQFVEEYAAVCKRHKVPTSLIELEVTETIIFEDPELFACLVGEMHAYGFTCSMDDFGSGYSSLNVLKDINVDTLKLDRAFFSSEQMEDARERDVVASVIDLAKKLKISTVAEGVETQPQQTFLEGTECDLLQGFVFSQPLPVEAYERLVFGAPIE